MNEALLLGLDEGTTSTRAMLYGADGTRQGAAQANLTQSYPRPGWVEHDAEEIWRLTLGCAREMVLLAGGAEKIAAIGIANQRETIVAWDRRSGAPIAQAIVWQDRRTADQCAALREAGHEPLIQQRTGLLLDPYFSGTKLRWIMDNVPEARAIGDALAFGTIESWLVWKLTGGLHITDASNASRTQLMALDGAGWDPELCALIGVPEAALPEIVDSVGRFGSTDPELFGAPIPICGMAGDQQSATIGQGCLKPGEVKGTFGTGAFVLANMGGEVPRSTHRLLGTVLCQIGGERSYALEGSVFVAGSLIKWLRDLVGLVETAADSEALARSVPDNGGVYFLPALSGLGAPHWWPDATGIITGLRLGTGRAHIVRAAMESLAHQCHDLMRAFAGDGAPWKTLRIDGGMSVNDWIAQDLADMLGLIVERPADVETTALGAAMLASVGAGLFPSLDQALAMRSPTVRFAPAMEESKRQRRLDGWERLLACSGHVPA
jgi:glycerol kinase